MAGSCIDIPVVYCSLFWVILLGCVPSRATVSFLSVWVLIVLIKRWGNKHGGIVGIWTPLSRKSVVFWGLRVAYLRLGQGDRK